MVRRILWTGLIVTVETVLLILLAATWGIPGARRKPRLRSAMPPRSNRA